MDDDPHRVESYMKEHKYTFPVIVGGELVQKMFLADGGIPQSWIIDREGRRSDQFRSWSLGRILMNILMK